MVALLTNKNDETRSGKPHKMETLVEMTQSWEMCGTRWPRNGLDEKRRRKRTLEDKYKFVTLVLSRMKLSVNTERHSVEELRRKSRTKHSETWDPRIPLSTFETKDLPYNCVVTAMWLANGSMANFLWGRSTKRRSDKFKGPYTHGGKRMSPNRFRTLTAS